MSTTQTPAEYEAMLTKHWDYEGFPTKDDAIHSVEEYASNTKAIGRSDAWPEFQPLIAKTEAQDYPLDALPPLIRNAVIEVCGFVKAPLALVAMSALAALSVAIQAHTRH